MNINSDYDSNSKQIPAKIEYLEIAEEVDINDEFHPFDQKISSQDVLNFIDELDDKKNFFVGEFDKKQLDRWLEEAQADAGDYFTDEHIRVCYFLNRFDHDSDFPPSSTDFPGEDILDNIDLIETYRPREVFLERHWHVMYAENQLRYEDGGIRAIPIPLKINCPKIEYKVLDPHPQVLEQQLRELSVFKAEKIGLVGLGIPVAELAEVFDLNVGTQYAGRELALVNEKGEKFELFSQDLNYLKKRFPDIFNDPLRVTLGRLAEKLYEPDLWQEDCNPENLSREELTYVLDGIADFLSRSDSVQLIVRDIPWYRDPVIKQIVTPRVVMATTSTDLEAFAAMALLSEKLKGANPNWSEKLEKISSQEAEEEWGVIKLAVADAALPVRERVDLITNWLNRGETEQLAPYRQAYEEKRQETMATVLSTALDYLKVKKQASVQGKQYNITYKNRTLTIADTSSGEIKITGKLVEQEWREISAPALSRGDIEQFLSQKPRIEQALATTQQKKGHGR